MKDVIIEISNDNYKLSLSRGFMVVEYPEMPATSIDMDQICSVILSAQKVSMTKNILIDLAERGIITILCDKSYVPSAIVTPVITNSAQVERLRLQIEASEPLKKNLWKAIVARKIYSQLDVLIRNKLSSPEIEKRMKSLAQNVSSGDTNNYEAQAAQLYWKQLFGSEFKRDRNLAGINELLNYGYMVLRAATARSIIGAGLQPSLGIHHKNIKNQFCLVDDLMEVFRPSVDFIVYDIVKKQRQLYLNKITKLELSKLISLDFETKNGTSPLSNCLTTLVVSVYKSYENRRPQLDLPKTLLPTCFIDGKI